MRALRARAPRARGRPGLAVDGERRAAPRHAARGGACVCAAPCAGWRARARAARSGLAPSRAWVAALGSRALRVCMNAPRLVEVTAADGGRVAVWRAIQCVCVPCAVHRLASRLHCATHQARLWQRAGAHCAGAIESGDPGPPPCTSSLPIARAHCASPCCEQSRRFVVHICAVWCVSMTTNPHLMALNETQTQRGP